MTSKPRKPPATASTPQPPDHLTPASAAWFQSVVGAFDLEPHHVRLLTLAAEAWDTSCRARETIAKDGGEVVKDRFGQPKAHPAVGIERDAKGTFARLLRELGLDAIDPEPPRPPVSASRRNGGR